MKKFLFLCVLAMSGFAASQASAQDYYPSQYDACCPQFDSCCGMDFGGVYIGGNVGAFSHTAHRNDLDGFLTDNSGWSTIDTNVTAGVQLGYDWKCGNKLFGIVADWNWVNTENDLRDDPNVDPDNRIHSEFEWFTTIRARAGITVCDALFYLTGGAAVTSIKTRWTDLPDDFHNRDTRWGWVGGVGTEFLVTCNFSVGAEFLFLQFNDHTETFVGAADTFSFGHSDSAWIGRVTLNYRFGDLF
jgi:outer membrane immunogenic protein